MATPAGRWGLLARAEKASLRRAGTTCVRPERTTHRLTPSTGGGKGYIIVPPPAGPDNDQGEGIVPTLPAGTLRPIKTPGQSSGLAPDPQAPGTGPTASIASNPLTFFRISDAGIPPVTASPQEMTTAIGRNVAWLTGNTSVALSTTAGQTFSMFNPSNLLPDDGRSFCCDQQVTYSPHYDLFVWVMQYWCQTSCLPTNPQTGKSGCPAAGQSNGSNRIRIAVASPEALKADAANPGAAWTYWDLTPQDFGQPANAWFDRSDLSVNQVNANWDVDIICGNASSLLTRISLQQLLDRGTVSVNYITDSSAAMRAAQGLDTTTTYFTGKQQRQPGAHLVVERRVGDLFLHNVNHSTVPGSDSAVDGTGGSDWLDRYGIFPVEVDSATVTGVDAVLGPGHRARGVHRELLQQDADAEVGVRRAGDRRLPLRRQLLETAGRALVVESDAAFACRALEKRRRRGRREITFVTSDANQEPDRSPGSSRRASSRLRPTGRPAQETATSGNLQPGRTDQSSSPSGATVQSSGGGGADHWFYIEYGIGPSPYKSPPNVDHVPGQRADPQLPRGDRPSPTRGQATDAIDGTLNGGALVWTEDGNAIGTGTQTTHTETAPGLHTITLTATNGDGKSASSSITIRVLAPPPPGAPTVNVSSPSDREFFCAGTNVNGTYYASVQFTASSNPATGVTYRWTDSINGGTATQVSTQLSPALDLAYTPPAGSGETTHDLTLTATNAGGTGTAQVRVIVYSPGCIQ